MENVGGTVVDYKIKPNIHHYLGIEMNSQTWNLLMKKDRKEYENNRMIALVYASQYHWYRSPTWKPLNAQRGEWLISHVFAALKNGEEALEHAEKCMELTKEHKLEDFDLAYAFEALTRAYKILGNEDKQKEYFKSAELAGEKIADEEDKKIFFADLNY